MKILVLKTHAFGDALIATSAVSKLIKKGHKVTILAGNSSFDVWNRLPGVTDVVLSPAPCSFFKLFSWSLTNRQTGFDKVIYFGFSKMVVSWLSLLTGSKVTSGHSSSLGFGIEAPASREYCRLAGMDYQNLKPIFKPTYEEIQKISELAGSKSYVVLAPGGGRNVRDFVPEKKWPIDRWEQIAQFLMLLNYQVFLVGGKDDFSEISSIDGVNLAGKLSWGETAALISKAEIFVGNDSGPAHLAVAVDTLALVLFGPTDPDTLYERGSITTIRTDVSCSPCYSNSIFPGCRNDKKCMTSITIKKVKATLEEMLNNENNST